VSPAAQLRTALISILAATVLVALKLGTGLAVGSLGLISAGIESSGDVVAAIFTFLAIRLGAKPADQDHPYGHRRVENLSALAEAVILAAGGIIVVSEAIGRLRGGGVSLDPAWYVFAVIGIAMLIDISRVLISLRTARASGSAALRSNAFHFAGDFAGSTAVLAGLIGVKLGWESADAVAALVVSVIIFFAAYRLIFENARVLMDRAPEDVRRAARDAVRALSPEVELRRLRLRESAGRYFVDVTVGVPPAAAVVEGHALADRVEQAVQQAIAGSDVVVHTEPRDRDIDLRDRVLATALAHPQVREAHDIAIFEHGEHVSVSLHLKFARNVSLVEAHRSAEEVEAQLLELPEVDAVQTHLEPLEQPVAERRPSDPGDTSARTAAVEELVRKRLGRGPSLVRLISTDAGVVLFLTVPIDAATPLVKAHQVASELEEELHRIFDDLVDVVVHTDPLPAD
jgi:cation diffusion facilitator family transporter